MTHGLYLYGILADNQTQSDEIRSLPEDLQGLDKQPIQTKSFEDFTLLYSEAKQAKYMASRRNLLGHENVLEKAMESGYRNLLPLRFGLMVESWNQVEEELFVPYQEKMRSLLTKLEGTREVSVKIFWEPEAELQQMMVENEDLQAARDRQQGQAMGMDAVIKFGQAVERAMVQRRDAVINAFQDALSPLAIEQVENDALNESMIYNTAFLIDWDQEAAFSQTVDAVDATFGDRLKIRYNNFTAPYNFAQFN
jgi:Gas vesicle synthesis protein GvpL/GvpF